MSDTLVAAVVGAVVGGAIAILASFVAVILTGRLERGRRRRDHEIQQVRNTVQVLDGWTEFASALLRGWIEVGPEHENPMEPDTRQRIDAAQAHLRQLDVSVWDWELGLIPGPAAKELWTMCVDIQLRVGMLGGGDRPGNGPFEQAATLGQLQIEMRAAATARVKALS